MKNIVFFAVGAAVVAGGAYLALKYWLNSTKNITKVILTDTFCKDTIKNWIDSLDTYDVDSNCKFFVIKTDYGDLEKLNFSNEDIINIKKDIIKDIKNKKFDGEIDSDFIIGYFKRYQNNYNLHTF